MVALLLVTALVFVLLHRQSPQVMEVISRLHSSPLIAAVYNASLWSLDKDSVYEADVSRWYKNSAHSGKNEAFVGTKPLFPPCQPQGRPGVPTWGPNPYIGGFRFLEKSQNPCWWPEGGERTDSAVPRCVPYFFLIGVSKSGTSDLFHRITSHPDVRPTVKEAHWFDRNRYGQAKKDFASYTSNYAKVAAAVKRDLQTGEESRVICGDASPSYFYDNDFWPQYSGNEGCTEPRVLLAHQIRYLNPDAKIILIFRHPVTRLYARYMFDRQRNRGNPGDPASADNFHRYVTEGLSRYRQCFNRWSLRHCLYNATLGSSVHQLWMQESVYPVILENWLFLCPRLRIQKSVYPVLLNVWLFLCPQLRIRESVYPVLLDDWLRVVPRNNFLFIRLEDHSKDLAKGMARIFDFLHLEKPNGESMKKIANRSISNKGRLTTSVGPMLPETKRILLDFYNPFMRRLADMLEDDRYLWKDVEVKTSSS